MYKKNFKFYNITLCFHLRVPRLDADDDDDPQISLVKSSHMCSKSSPLSDQPEGLHSVQNNIINILIQPFTYVGHQLTINK